jgi:deoxyribodipyrimidine photolyase
MQSTASTSSSGNPTSDHKPAKRAGKSSAHKAVSQDIKQETLHVQAERIKQLEAALKLAQAQVAEKETSLQELNAKFLLVELSTAEKIGVLQKELQAKNDEILRLKSESQSQVASKGADAPGEAEANHLKEPTKLQDVGQGTPATFTSYLRKINECKAKVSPIFDQRATLAPDQMPIAEFLQDYLDLTSDFYKLSNPLDEEIETRKAVIEAIQDLNLKIVKIGRRVDGTWGKINTYNPLTEPDRLMPFNPVIK